MSTVNSPVSPILIRHLAAEINRLTQQQLDALRNATFFGMTEGDVREFQKRKKGIRELARELEVITSCRNMDDHRTEALYEQEAKEIARNR